METENQAVRIAEVHSLSIKIGKLLTYEAYPKFIIISCCEMNGDQPQLLFTCGSDNMPHLPLFSVAFSGLHDGQIMPL